MGRKERERESGKGRKGEGKRGRCSDNFIIFVKLIDNNYEWG